MKLAIGYQLPDPDRGSTVDLVRDYLPHIGEVYFPWAAMASGRADLTRRLGHVDWQGQRRLEDDLVELRRLGVRLNLLFNANCYGGRAVSRHLQNEVTSLLDHLADLAGGVDTVTTTSPAIAHIIRRHDPGIAVRASVNMRIGTIHAMEHVADLFDGFCVQREYNRDLDHLARLKTWADAHGKHLQILVNSGCLAHCAAQTFHDNLVAHETDIDETVNIDDWQPTVCHRLVRQGGRWPLVLQATWIRPEDLHHYDALFDSAKLATRMHDRPRLVVDAYSRRRHRGNLLDLLEPGFAPALAPRIIDNDRFPDDWFARTSTCRRRCESCDYCDRVLEHVTV